MDEKKTDNPDPHSKDQDLMEVARVWGLAAADVIKSYLESNGIPSYYRTQAVPTIFTLTTDGMGEIKIMVLAGDYETAKELLETKAEETT